MRVKIIGTRTEVGEMWAIGSIKEDYLGYGGCCQLLCVWSTNAGEQMPPGLMGYEHPCTSRALRRSGTGLTTSSLICNANNNGQLHWRRIISSMVCLDIAGLLNQRRLGNAPFGTSNKAEKRSQTEKIAISYVCSRTHFSRSSFSLFDRMNGQAVSLLLIIRFFETGLDHNQRMAFLFWRMENGENK